MLICVLRWFNILTTLHFSISGSFIFLSYLVQSSACQRQLPLLSFCPVLPSMPLCPITYIYLNAHVPSIVVFGDNRVFHRRKTNDAKR